jgi:hypothetical protein
MIFLIARYSRNSPTPTSPKRRFGETRIILKHSIRAFRSPSNVIVIPKDAILRDVRTSVEPGYLFPAAMTDAARKNPSLHIFEYQGETLYMHFAYGLIEATTEVTPE